MAKGGRGRRRIASRQYQSTPYPLMSCNQDILKDLCPRRCSKGLDKKDWEDVTCSVCMEYPHNAVLLLCSSHDNGCRPYMCGTSFRYSNCLDQYKKALTKVIPNSGTVENPIVVSDSGWSVEKCGVSELACPFCRGQVKGWTVVEPAREYLNEKRRSCVQDNCSFVGTYKELRKHMKANHPCAQPRELDPVLEQNWRSLERERERDDIMSTIRSAMPGAMVFGDYVIEGNHYDFVDEEDRGFDADGGRHGGFGVGLDSNLVNVFFLLHHEFGPSDNDLSRRLRQSERASRHPSDDGTAGVRRISAVGSLDSSDQDDDSDVNNDNGDDGSVSTVNLLRRHRRVLLGQSARRRRHREANGSHG